MSSDSRRRGCFDPEVARLRAEWVVAFRAWTRVANGKSLTSVGLSPDQQAAVRRYRDAESAYFNYLRMK